MDTSKLFYTFQSGNGTALIPLFDVCEIIVSSLMNPKKPGELLAALTDQEARNYEREVEYFEDMLHDRGRSSTFFDPHAVVVVPKNYGEN